MRPDEILRLALRKTDNEQSLAVVYAAALEAFRRTSFRSIALEFGTRSGGSALALLAAILETDSRRVLVTVDPYGELPYQNDKGLLPWKYTSDHYRDAMSEVSAVAKAEKLNWVHYLAKDEEYMECIWPVIPLYLLEPAERSPSLAFAYLDAEHTNEAVRKALLWAKGRLEKGGTIVVDDVDWLSDKGEWMLSECPTAVRREGKIVIGPEPTSTPRTPIGQ